MTPSGGTENGMYVYLCIWNEMRSNVIDVDLSWNWLDFANWNMTSLGSFHFPFLFLDIIASYQYTIYNINIKTNINTRFYHSKLEEQEIHNHPRYREFDSVRKLMKNTKKPNASPAHEFSTLHLDGRMYKHFTTHAKLREPAWNIRRDSKIWRLPAKNRPQGSKVDSWRITYFFVILAVWALLYVTCYLWCWPSLSSDKIGGLGRPPLRLVVATKSVATV